MEDLILVAWESAMKSVKSVLKITFMEFITILKPVGTVALSLLNLPDGIAVLTPGNFLIGVQNPYLIFNFHTDLYLSLSIPSLPFLGMLV